MAHPTPRDTARPAGASGFYLAAAAGTALSVNTSWRFFGVVIGITDWRERAAMFAVLEVALVACGWAMRANVRRPGGTPGMARTLAWVLCGVSAYMAIVLSGPVVGVARVLLGPVLALVCLHLALGIEIRARHGEDTGTWGRVRGEIRERLLSRLGLGDDQRDALARSRDRARDRAARLATARGWVPWRTRRLARAVRASGATLDDAQRDALVGQVGALRHLGDLITVALPSPWLAHAQAEVAAGTSPVAVTGTSAGSSAPPPTGTSARNNGRKVATRRTAEQTRKLVDRIRRQDPEITQEALAAKLRISTRQLRNVLNGTDAPAPAVERERANGHEVPALLPTGSQP